MAKNNTVTVTILGNASGMNKALSEAASSADGFGSKFGGVMKGAGVAAALGGAGIAFGLGKIAVDGIQKASSLNETMSKVGVVFGQSAGEVNKYADEMSKKFGITRQTSLDAAASLGLVAKASGLGQKAAADLSTKFVTLAGDMSSFYDVPVNEALDAIKSGLVGEAEPLRKFGVLLNEDTVKAEAFRLGLVKAGADTLKVQAAQVSLEKATSAAAKAMKEHGANSDEYRHALVAVQVAEARLKKETAGKIPDLNEQQKVQARASLIQRQLGDASGDLERTQGSLANRMRELRGRIDEIVTRIGGALLPIAVNLANAVIPLIGHFGDFADKVSAGVGPALANLQPHLIAAGAFLSETLGPTVRGLIDDFHTKWVPAMQAAGAAVVDLVQRGLNQLKSAFEENRPQIEQLLGAFRSVVGFIGQWVVPVLTVVVGMVGGTMIVAFASAIRYVGLMVDAWNRLWDVGRAVGGFFGGVGDSIAGAFRVAVDGVRSALNWIIDKWNALEIPAVSALGVQLSPAVGTPNIQRLAAGGIVRARPGGVLANIGEGRHDEAVVPLDGRHSIGGGDTYNVTLQFTAPVNDRASAEWVARRVEDFLSGGGQIRDSRGRRVQVA